MSLLGILTISCVLPTEMCGCPPARSSVYLMARVVDGQSVPMPGVRVYAYPFRQPGPLPYEYVYGLGMRTDSMGEFRGLLYSSSSPGTHWLHLTVISNDLRDTIRIQGGEAMLRYERNVPDTVHMTFQVSAVGIAEHR